MRAEALDALSDVRSWQLAEERWPRIYQVLVAMAAAADVGDPDALAAATVQLEMAGPLRIIPIDLATGPTPPVRDLLNKLVHTLGGLTAGQLREPGDAGAVDADLPRG